MHVHLGGLLGRLISSETIYYVDSKRHILIYGIGRDGPSSLRVIWILPSDNGRASWFHSHDVIGGYPALLPRWYIEGLVLKGFTAHHHALKKRVEELHMKS